MVATLHELRSHPLSIYSDCQKLRVDLLLLSGIESSIAARLQDVPTVGGGDGTGPPTAAEQDRRLEPQATSVLQCCEARWSTLFSGVCCNLARVAKSPSIKSFQTRIEPKCGAPKLLASPGTHAFLGSSHRCLWQAPENSVVEAAGALGFLFVQV